MSIGERIGNLRKEKNMSQTDLAKAMSVSRQAVSKWESDSASPDTLKLIKLAEILDTEVEFLATGSKTPQTPPPIYVNLVQNEEKVREKIVEKPVIHRVIRTRYRQNPLTLAIAIVMSFLAGLLAGALIF